MRVVFTDEMRALKEIFEPYEEGCHLVNNAPPEAVEAREKFLKLYDFEREKYSNIDLL